MQLLLFFFNHSNTTINQVLVQRNDSELLMIEELRRTIEHLEHEDNKKTEERHKYARDIEQVRHLGKHDDPKGNPFTDN